MLTAIDTHGIWKKLLQQPGKVAKISIDYSNGHSMKLQLTLKQSGNAQQWTASCSD